MVIIEEKGVQVKKERKDRKGSGFDSLLKTQMYIIFTQPVP